MEGRGLLRPCGLSRKEVEAGGSSGPPDQFGPEENGSGKEEEGYKGLNLALAPDDDPHLAWGCTG